MATIRFSVSSWRKYQTWESHKEYFERAPENRKVETWMTPKFIKSHYKIKKIPESVEKLGFWEKRDTLEKLCKKRQLDCDVLIKQLNQQIGK